MREYQKLSNNFYFSKVQRIIVSDNPVAETGSLGESSLSDIKLLYTGFEGGDSLHAAHELDHHYLQELFSGITGGARDSNNLIHYAGSVSYPYTYSRKAKYLTKTMWLKGEPVDGGLLGDTSPLDKYCPYGIRNSFGLDYDLLLKKA